MKMPLLLRLLPLPFSALSAQTPTHPAAPGASIPSPTPTASVAPASQDQAAPIPTPPSRIMTEDNFRAFLVGTTWKWTGRNGDAETVTFYTDGTLRNSWGWVAKFVIKSLTEVQLRKEGRAAKMTFDKTYTHYDGIDFDGTWPLKGQREK